MGTSQQSSAVTFASLKPSATTSASQLAPKVNEESAQGYAKEISSKRQKKKRKKKDQNKTTTNKEYEAVAENTNNETEDSSAAASDVSEIQGGARPKTTKKKRKTGQNKNMISENVAENSNQELSNTNNVKDVISLISNKNNSELSVEELEVLEALAVVKLQNASSELKDLDKVVPDIARSRAAKLRQTYEQIDSIEEQKLSKEEEKAALQDDIRDIQEKINVLQEKIKLLDCEDKNFDQILEELNNQRREQEKENDEIKEQNAKAKIEHLAKISSWEENLKKIRNDKMEKSKNKGMSLPKPLAVTDKRASDEAESGQETVCPICLYSYKEIKQKGVRLVSTQCGHIYCHKCMDEVMDATSGDTKCPICNKRITRNSYHTLFL